MATDTVSAQRKRARKRALCWNCLGILAKKQAGFPSNPVRRGSQLFEGAILNLTNAFFADAEKMTDLPQTVGTVTGEPETEVEHFSFARPQVFHQEG